MWQWLFGPDVQHKECIKGKKPPLEVGIRAHSEGREGRVVKCWLKRGENQSSKPVWLTACQGVFCGGVKNSTIALPRPPSLSVLPPTPPLSHPSLASSPIITLSSPPKRLTKLRQYLWLFRPLFLLFHYLSRNLPFSLLVVPSFSDGGQRCIHRQPFKAADWHSFNLVVL